MCMSPVFGDTIWHIAKTRLSGCGGHLSSVGWCPQVEVGGGVGDGDTECEAHTAFGRCGFRVAGV